MGLAALFMGASRLIIRVGGRLVWANRCGPNLCAPPIGQVCIWVSVASRLIALMFRQHAARLSCPRFAPSYQALAGVYLARVGQSGCLFARRNFTPKRMGQRISWQHHAACPNPSGNWGQRAMGNCCEKGNIRSTFRCAWPARGSFCLSRNL